jgi:hypothetical protein
MKINKNMDKNMRVIVDLVKNMEVANFITKMVDIMTGNGKMM